MVRCVGTVCGLASRDGLRGLVIASLPLLLLLCSCTAPQLSPVPSNPTPLSHPPVPASGDTPPASQAAEGLPQDPRPRRAQLERRLQAVVICLEEVRRAVVVAEVDGAGIEEVQPAIDALHRSESALRKAQTELMDGDVGQAVVPLDRAEAECRAAREFGQQT